MACKRNVPLALSAPSGSLLDSSGYPVGDPATIEVRIAGLSAAGDGRVRAWHLSES